MILMIFIPLLLAFPAWKRIGPVSRNAGLAIMRCVYAFVSVLSMPNFRLSRTCVITLAS